MLENYKTNTVEEKKNAIKEVMQEIILASLSKTSFFKNVAFYGGTALRIFYGLNRFSEDLDFTLITSDNDFELSDYFNEIKHTVRAMGLNFEVTEKIKSKETQIKSAFLKGNTKEQFLVFYPNLEEKPPISSNEKIQIKFEIDTNPPEYANTEVKYRLLPFPYQVRVYDKPSLFAGKLHAVIVRSWKNKIKGRDLYDYIYYISTNTPLNIKHLEARLKQTNTIKEDVNLDKGMLIKILNKRFDEIDYENAKEDVSPFITNKRELDLWSSEFFKSISENIIIE